MLDGLDAGVAAHVRDAMVQACATQHLLITDVVVGACSVVVTHDQDAAPQIRELLQQLGERITTAAIPTTRPTMEIPVRYDGADLHHVAQQCGLRTNDVIALHSDAQYVVEFCGFSPGFAYLAGLPSALYMARRSIPRPRVPSGSVAIATTYSAVYPRESPGGWHLIGTTDFELWNIARTHPATLTPGTLVRFVATT
jgi:KipI family sensor histidine kinase inhibitor